MSSGMLLLIVGVCAAISIWLFWQARPRRSEPPRPRQSTTPAVLTGDEPAAVPLVTFSVQLVPAAPAGPPGPPTARIGYADFAGEVTVRDIHPWRVVKDGRDLRIEAWCFLRGEHRSFRGSRIRELIDLSTGEVVEDVFAWLLAIPGRRRRAPPRPGPSESPRRVRG